jgi:[1-hydroxy-2-(trimethylamino)ethyl]phosphonate dioxygenase
MSVVDETFALFARHGAGAYFGEPVSMLQHGLQAAHFATEERAPAPLIVAALLHDIGHLLEDLPEDIAAWHADARHEAIGGAWLANRFGPEVGNPVRLHVAAKRYLCAVDPAYFAKLSSASVLTLKLQGGPMSTREVAGFEAEPFYREAVQVRRYDDRGKIVGLEVAGLSAYRNLIESVATPRS